MWPWEHLLFGYVAYSLSLRSVTGDRPGERDTLVLALATQLPDVVDKPLAWSVGVLPSGTSVAHSILVAVPACLLVLALARALDAEPAGAAFTVGYLSHLAGDVVYPFLVGGGLPVWILLWPITDVASPARPGILPRTVELFGQFRRFLDTPRGQLYVLLEVGFLGVAVVVWLLDGHPGTRLARWRSDNR